MKKVSISLFILFLLLFSIKLTAQYNQLPGFPYSAEQNTSFCAHDGVGVVNINDDPFLEIVVSNYNTTFAINYLGECLWTTDTANEAQPTMSFADITNDGYLEILQTTRSGWVYILDKDGNNIPEWPKHFGSYGGVYCRTITTAVVYDIDGDGQKEIMWGNTDYNHQCGLYVVTIDGENYNENFPFYIDGGVACPPAVGDVDNDGIPEIVCMAHNSNLYIFKPDGTVMDGWPQQPFNGNANYWMTSPILADLTGDGFLEIIAPASGDYTTPQPTGIYVYKYDGSVLDGWPRQFPDITMCPPSVADLNNNGSLEIICGCHNTYQSNNTIYIYNVNGEYFSNAPYYSFGDVYGPIIIGNIDGSPEKEIIFDSNFGTPPPLLGYIEGRHCNGDSIDGFPLRPRGFTTSNSGIFGDINQDGILDLVTYSQDLDSLWIYAYNLNVPYDPLQIEWKTYQYDFQRLGQYHPPFSFDPPSKVQASADSHGINLSWDQPANQRNYAYSIFRDDNLLARTPYTSFCDSLVQSYTTYHYYIQSVYEQGYSPPSEVIEVKTDSILSVDNLPYSNTSEISLNCFPNPFSSSTTISRTPSPGQAEIKIYNVKGQLVKEFKSQKVKGKNNIVWNGKDENGKQVPNGIYFYKLSNGKEEIVRKMVLLR